jgi:hypothetical protein
MCLVAYRSCLKIPQQPRAYLRIRVSADIGAGPTDGIRIGARISKRGRNA